MRDYAEVKHEGPTVAQQKYVLSKLNAAEDLLVTMMDRGKRTRAAGTPRAMRSSRVLSLMASNGTSL